MKLPCDFYQRHCAFRPCEEVPGVAKIALVCPEMLLCRPNPTVVWTSVLWPSALQFEREVTVLVTKGF